MYICVSLLCRLIPLCTPQTATCSGWEHSLAVLWVIRAAYKLMHCVCQRQVALFSDDSKCM
jgi:hypothetical protein